jgi:DNA end-binding protein Ku
MADRPIWRGQLRLALVSCPIALYGAHKERGNLHFHFINPATGNRVRMVTLDAQTDEELSRRDLARGYEYEKDQYVLLDEEDFDQARIDSSATLAVSKFVEAADIDPVYYDTSYYVAPDGDVGQDVYVVLRDAIRATGRVALSRIVISRRERAVCLMPMGKGLVLHTLYEARDIAKPDEFFSRVPADKPDAEMVKLARQLIDRQTEPFDPADMEDRYEARLRDVIDAKIKGQGLKPAAQEPERSNVVDLMAALKRSLGQSAEKPAPKPKTAASKARAPARKRA